MIEVKVSENNSPEENTNSNPKNSRVGFFRKLFKTFNYKLHNLHGLDKYVIFCFTSLIIFTTVIITIFALTGQEPSTLVGCFFAAFGGEVLCCALIKKFKLDKQYRGGDPDGDNSSC